MHNWQKITTFASQTKEKEKNMERYPIPLSDIEKVKQWQNCGWIDNSIMLIDQLTEVHIPESPRRMNFIIMGLCTQGEIQYTLDTQPHTVKAGDVFIVSERHVISDYSATPDIQGGCFLISVSFFREVIQNTSDLSALFLYTQNFPVMHLEEKEADVFKKYFTAIRQRINDNKNHFRKDLVRTLLLAMFYDLSNVIYHFREDTGKKHTRADAIFTKFIKMVEENCHFERRVSWYAEQLCITPKYLSESIKTVSRRTPNEWIDNYVTLELRVLLKNTSKSVKEIAEDMNFPNQSFLGKYFKERVGISPSKYRKK